MELDFGDFQKALHERMDYSSEILCEEPGQYSLRGGIIDVYPVNANQPYRIDFFGNVVDDIRAFDPTSQRTSEKKSEIVLSSLKEEEENAREGEFFSYLSDSTTWAFLEPEALISEFPLAFHQSEEKKFQKACLELAWKESSNQNIFLGFSEIDAGSGIFEKMPSRIIQCKTSGSTRRCGY